MDDISRSINQYVKSGKYYEDARIWYVNRFIMPVSEKSYLVILVAIYVIVLAVGAYYYSNTHPADPEISYLVFRDDVSKTYAIVKPVGKDKEIPQIGISKYLLESYVENRESYDIKNIHKQLAYVRNTTIPSNYSKYEDMMSINNPSSPMMIYQDLYTKAIKIHKVNLLKSSSEVGYKLNPASGSMKAVVYFQSILKNIATNKDVFEEYVATIDFNVENIEEIIKEDSKKLGFLVSGYNLHQIKK